MYEFGPYIYIYLLRIFYRGKIIAEEHAIHSVLRLSPARVSFPSRSRPRANISRYLNNFIINAAVTPHYRGFVYNGAMYICNIRRAGRT